MTVFKILPDYENYLAFQLPLKDLIRKLGGRIPAKKLMHFGKHNIALGDVWADVTGKFEPIDGVTIRESVPDIAVWTAGALIMSGAAKNELYDSLEAQGEFLPVTTSNGIYWAYNCLAIIHADEEHSSRVVENGQVLDVEALTFREDEIGSNLVFKTDYDGCRTLFCTDIFVTKLRELGLGGVVFSTALTGAF